MRAGRVTWIPDAPMDSLRTRKHWTLFRRRIANGNDRVESLPIEFRNGFGALAGNVDADFAHRFDSQRADVAIRPAPRTVHLIRIAAKPAKQSFSHLAPRAISGAQDKNAMGHGLPAMIHAQQAGPQHADFTAGFTAPTNALMNFPSICGPTVSASSPAACRNSHASSTR